MREREPGHVYTYDVIPKYCFILVKVGARPWSCVHIWFFCTIECYFSGKDGGGGGPGNVFTCCVLS